MGDRLKLSVHDLGQMTVAAALATGKVREVATVTRVTESVVRRRLRDVRGNNLLRSVLAWPDDDDEFDPRALGKLTAKKALHDVYIPAIAWCAEVTPGAARKALGDATRNSRVRNILPWPDPDAWRLRKAEALEHLTAVAARDGFIRRIARVTRRFESFVQERLEQAPDMTLVQNVFAGSWPRADRHVAAWDDEEAGDETPDGPPDGEADEPETEEHLARPDAVGTSPARIELLSDPVDVQAAFVAACDWCEELALATPVAASTAGAWPPWAALERNASKVRAAFVALDGLRSEPAALAWFHDHDCLRFVPAADGSFQANVYRFQRGAQVRVLMGAGRLAPAGLMAPLDAMLLWEGSAVDAFAASIDALLHKAREKAHVPSSEELAEYSRAFYAGVELWDQLVELGAPFIRSTAHDADMAELELIVDATTTRAAMKSVQQQLASVATDKREQKVGFHGGSDTYTLHWCAPLKLWVFFQKLDNRYWNAFGIMRPDPDKSLQITVEVNPPLEGIERKMGGAFARDPSTGDIYLVHRGRIGGGQKGIGAELFWSRFRGGVSMREPDRAETSRVVIVGRVGAPEFPRNVAGFVHEVGRIKAAASQ